MLKCYMKHLKSSVICHAEFSKVNVQEFLYLLNHVTWQEVQVQSHVNAKFNAFQGVFFIIMTQLFQSKQYV